MREQIKLALCEYMDIHDSETRKQILALDEADQTSVLLSLTSKLYTMIIDKVTDIDFGDIPESKGDVTMLESYEKMVDVIDTLTGILEQYRQPTDTIDVIRAALDNLENDKQLYKRGFQAKIDIVITTYNTMVLSIINSLSYMIAVTIEFIKNPGNGNGFKVILDKSGIARTRDSLVYANLVRFNKACNDGDIEKAFNPLIKAKARGLIGASLGTIATGIAVAAILVNILPIIRELTYFFFAINTRISQYFDLQADLLEMNAQMIKNNEVHTVEDKKLVVSRQLSIAGRFRKIAEFFTVKTKEADRDADKDLKSDIKAYKVNDVMDQAPDSIASNGSLF
jgi:hypothetical protein|nr:MAG TPA: hypothetical protein [Caudoviricetes sp.]